MATSNFNDEEYLKQFTKDDYILEETNDNSSTFEYLLESVTNQYVEKKQHLQKLKEKKTTQEAALNSENKLLFSLQEKRLKMDEMMNKRIDNIAALEMERDDMVKNYTKTIDNLHNKLSSIEDELNPDSLKQQIIDLKQTQKEIEADMKRINKEKEEVEEYMNKLDIDIPDFRILRQITNEMLENSKDLEEKKRESENLKIFISDLKAKLDDSKK